MFLLTHVNCLRNHKAVIASSDVFTNIGNAIVIEEFFRRHNFLQIGILPPSPPLSAEFDQDEDISHWLNFWLDDSQAEDSNRRANLECYNNNNHVEDASEPPFPGLECSRNGDYNDRKSMELLCHHPKEIANPHLLEDPSAKVSHDENIEPLPVSFESDNYSLRRSHFPQPVNNPVINESTGKDIHEGFSQILPTSDQASYPESDVLEQENIERPLHHFHSNGAFIKSPGLTLLLAKDDASQRLVRRLVVSRFLSCIEKPILFMGRATKAPYSIQLCINDEISSLSDMIWSLDFVYRSCLLGPRMWKGFSSVRIESDNSCLPVVQVPIRLESFPWCLLFRLQDFTRLWDLKSISSRPLLTYDIDSHADPAAIIMMPEALSKCSTSEPKTDHLELLGNLAEIPERGLLNSEEALNDTVSERDIGDSISADLMEQDSREKKQYSLFSQSTVFGENDQSDEFNIARELHPKREFVEDAIIASSKKSLLGAFLLSLIVVSGVLMKLIIARIRL